jgi:phosphonopyruvate decarboxylase
MQNSGLGNAVNPLLSLVDREIYNIPLLMLIGWRGKPGMRDEPQHIKQGRVTIPLLDCMEIKNAVLSKDVCEIARQIDDACIYMKARKEPYAFIVEKDTFENYALRDKPARASRLSREEAIRLVIDSIDTSDAVVSTTGMISRELFEYRERKNQGHDRDFLSVGSMGHASHIALGIALKKKEKRVYCFDGDGSLLMHMGSMAVIGAMNPGNFIHVVFNNGAHDSVGGQPTVALDIDLCNVASSCGYNAVFLAETKDGLEKALDKIKRKEGLCFLEVRVKKGARSDLGRPGGTPKENRDAFMNFIKG